MTSNKEVDLRTALGLAFERREEIMWQNFFDTFVDVMYRSADYTHTEIRDAVGYVLGDRGYDRFDERYGVDDPNAED